MIDYGSGCTARRLVNYVWRPKAKAKAKATAEAAAEVTANGDSLVVDEGHGHLAEESTDVRAARRLRHCRPVMTVVGLGRVGGPSRGELGKKNTKTDSNNNSRKRSSTGSCHAFMRYHQSRTQNIKSTAMRCVCGNTERANEQKHADCNTTSLVHRIESNRIYGVTV